MKKKIFYSEFAYIVGLISLAISVMFMEKSDFGVSMIVAPAYIIFRKLNPVFDFFSFGMAEYCLQAVIIAIIWLITRKFKWNFLLSFVTAVIYGFILDGCMFLGAYLPADFIWQRIIYYIIGTVIGPVGVSFMFRTYIAPEAYELFVKELSSFFKVEIHKFKTGYDCVSCLISVVLSFVFFGFGRFVGVNWGTIVSALINGYLISIVTKITSKRWCFVDKFKFKNIMDKN